MVDNKVKLQKRIITRGIRDWNEKKDALRTLFGQWGDRELAIAIYGLEQVSASYTDDVEALRGSFKSWVDHLPTGATGRRFLDELVKRLVEKRSGLRGNETDVRSVIVEGTIAQFLQLLPEKTRAIINGQSETMNDVFDAQYFPRNTQQESISAVLARERIDQKFHYLTPDAEEIWRDVVGSGSYRQYDECKTALDVLFRDKKGVWQQFFLRGCADGAVMLGCGAGKKDSLIIRSMLSLVPEGQVHYALVDFSPFMLKAAYYHVNRELRNDNLSERVKVTPYELDFVDNFAHAGARMTRLGQHVAWMLPGGTIGNLNERLLFESLAAASKEGDLLVVGAETVDPGWKPDPTALTDKYDTPEVRRFVEMPFRSVLRASRIEVPPPITVKVVEDPNNSEIKGSMIVEVSSSVHGRKITLLTSARYNENNLVAFAAKKGFEKEAIVSSPLNERYKQFVFRRVQTSQ